MREQLAAQLKRIIKATAITSPLEFSFAGQVTRVPAEGAPPSQFNTMPTVPLVQYLFQCYYQYCYVQPFKDDLPPLETSQVTLNESLIQQLSESNDTKDRWETGWQIAEILPTGQIRADKHGRTRYMWAGEFLSNQGFGVQPQPGMQINAFFPKESATIQPGFFFTFGQTFKDSWEESNAMRLYWHIDETGAPKLLRGISSRLNRFRIPYRFKVLNNSLPFNRSDSAVLFLNRRYYRIAIELMAEVHKEVKGHLKPETPLFTKHMGRGLGLAEDPNNGDSFGMSRCRMVAEGLWNAFNLGVTGDKERFEQVEKQFESYGISLDRPYLNGGAIDQYISPGFAK